MASFISRLLGRGSAEEAKLEPYKCFVCGEDTVYHCGVCGKYMCNQHTDPGSTTCVECAAEREAAVIQ